MSSLVVGPFQVLKITHHFNFHNCHHHCQCHLRVCNISNPIRSSVLNHWSISLKYHSNFIGRDDQCPSTLLVFKRLHIFGSNSNWNCWTSFIFGSWHLEMHENWARLHIRTFGSSHLNISDLFKYIYVCIRYICYLSQALVQLVVRLHVWVSNATNICNLGTCLRLG